MEYYFDYFEYYFMCCEFWLICFSPVIIEVPHFASLRGKEREITVLRSETGQTWREHTVASTEEAVHEALQGGFFPGK